MTRNGLFTLIAVLLAFALVIRSEPTALAQIEYWDPSGNGWLNLGNLVTINASPDGTFITGHLVGEFMPGRPTFDHPSTVFINSGGPSFIHAEGGGAVISTLSSAPAIQNGSDTMSIDTVARIYQIEVARTPEGLWQLRYGYYYANDPFRTFYALDYDEMPENIQDFELFPDVTLWPDGSNVATLPPGYSLLGILNPETGQPLAPGESVTIPNTGFMVTGPSIPGEVATTTWIPAGAGTLSPVDIPSGSLTTGTLTINRRDPRDITRPLFEGDERTLIHNAGGAYGVIRNHGSLTVNDAIIQTGTSEFGFYFGGVGIFHSFSRGWILIYDDDGIPTDVDSYASSGWGESVILNNTQIGSPTGGGYIIAFDPITGLPMIDPDTGGYIYLETGDGIAVDYRGTPRQVVSRIVAGDTIVADGVNGRIVAGQNITLRRNPVGSILHYPGWENGTFAEPQQTIYNIQYIGGPDIGIHAQAHSFNAARYDDVYLNSRYYVSQFFGGYMGTSQVLSPYYNQIQLNENSWIFAQTGISFGNTETYVGEGATRVFIDYTSGIYSPGYGMLSPVTPSGVLTSGSGYSGYGITDRFSLLHLRAVDGTTTYLLPKALYSGSFHEIQVDGKVITGAPSRAGIQFTITALTNMNPQDREKLYGVYYHDPSDEDADRWGNVYYSEATAHKFIAYNTQPDRVFWLKIDGRAPEPLTYFDYATQRWTVHPNAPNVRLNTGLYASRGPLPFFTTFDRSFGVGIDIVGTSMAYEGEVLPTGVAAWSTYYGPTVRLITAIGNDALIAGGSAHSGGAAMSFADLAHVASVIIGENNDVKNLSNLLFVSTGDTSSIPAVMTDFRQSVANYQAFDRMTSVKRGNFLYDPNLLYTDELLDDLRPDGQGNYESSRFHFDNAGVHGDIISAYNAVVTVWSGSGGFWTAGGAWNGEDAGYSIAISTLNSFWVHAHPGTVYYYDEILGVDSTTGPSYLLGHRDNIGSGFIAADGWTADDIPGRSLILDEVLLYFLAGRQPLNQPANILLSAGDSYGYADNPRHFREALARMVHFGSTYHTGLTSDELLDGYTRDGTLVVFSNGDIFSGNIYGGGVGDDYRTRILGAGGGLYFGTLMSYSGNIDLRFVDGTTIFNRNILEFADGSNIFRAPGIRVRDIYVEKTGHLMMNDAEFAVNPFMPMTATPDYASRLIIHDVFNEGIVSGNGTFQIAQRWDYANAVDYFEGYFINRGILAPGLPGFIGNNEHQARMLELTAYEKMLNTVSDSSGDGLWRQLMRGVPGGQFGTMTIFGSLRLMDEQERAIYDPMNPNYNARETIQHGQYHVTIGNDTIRDVFGKYAAIIANAKPTYNPATRTYDTSVLGEGEISREDWQTIAVEKLGTHLSWFSPSTIRNPQTGLPVLTPYEQFEYMLDPRRWTQLDHLLMRFGFSDVVSVHGTIPPYQYAYYGWGNSMYDLGTLPSSTIHNNPMLLGITQLGGVVQADRIYDTDANAHSKEKQTSFIIIASEGYTLDGSVKMITSATNNWVYANVDVMPFRMPSGQLPAVLTVIDDPNFYLSHVSKPGNSYNAKSVASALDDAVRTNPGLAASFQFGLNDPAVLRDVLRQVSGATRANSLVMNLISPSDSLFNQIGYGTGGLSTGNRGNIVFRNIQTGQLQQPYGQPAVPPPGTQFAPPMAGQTRGQSPIFRTGSIWGAYTHSTFLMGDDNNSFKYTSHRNGIMVGNEWNLTPSSVLGGVFSINEGTLNSLSDKVKSTDYTFGLYFVAAPFEQFELKSYLGGGYQTYKTDRYIRNSNMFIGFRPGATPDNLFGINDHYDSESRGHSFNWSIEFTRPFTVNPNFVIRPVTGFEYQNIKQNAYAERPALGSQATWTNNGTNMVEGSLVQGPTSGTYAMDYKSMTFARTLVRFGVNTESYFARGGWRFRLYHVGRLTGDRYPTSEQSFVSGSRTFNVRGADLGTSYCQVGSGLHFWLNQDRTATFFMNGDWNFSLNNRGYSMINVNIGTQLNF